MLNLSRYITQPQLSLFQVIHIIFASTIIVWLNQLLQIPQADYLTRGLGMIVVLTIIVIFIFGFVFPSNYVENLARGQYQKASEAINGAIGGIAKLALSSIICSAISGGLAYYITWNLLFSVVLACTFIVLFIIDIVLLRSVSV
jgi:hypothetical protein